MKIVDVVKGVLEREGRSLKIDEIYEEIVSKDLYPLSKNRPQHIIRTQVRRYCSGVDSTLSKSEDIFVEVGEDMYDLTARLRREGKDSFAMHPMIKSSYSLDKEYKDRIKTHDYVSVVNKLVEDYEEKGWAIDREYKYKKRLKKVKDVGERLENDFWCLLKVLGYKELNQGRNFKIEIKRPSAETLGKQVDVFAKDEETVVVAECKASNRVKKRSLQKDIEEFANLKGPIANEINRHYGGKLKIIWMFVTRNILWSNPDKARALGENIKITTERELNYYWAIAQHLGPAARYQFLAEFLKGQTIPELKDKSIPAIRGKLGGRKFYSFISTPRQLLKISFVNHRMLNDPDGAPSYQRLVERNRLKKIGAYIENGGFFPTNILLNFVEKPRFEIVHKDEETKIHYGNLYLPDKYRTAWIIDGQHRLYGYSKIDDKFSDQNISVIAFEQMEKGEEANLFVTINHEQKSVSKGLLDELEGELKWGSKIPTQRINALASRLISVLATDVNQPFYSKFEAQGETKNKERNLTVSGIKNGLVKSCLLGTAVMKRKEYEPGALCGLDDAETIDKSRNVLNYYFDQLREANFELWEAGGEGFLRTNNGVHAHLLFFAEIIKYFEEKSGLKARELDDGELFLSLQPYIDPITEVISKADKSEMAERFKVQYGSGGPRQYYFRLCRILKETIESFQPEGYLDWLNTQNQEKKDAADKKVQEMNSKVISAIGMIFKGKFGHNGYMEKAIGKKHNEIFTGAIGRRAKDGNIEVPVEEYLFFIECKKIVEDREYWPLFRNIFNIPEMGEKGLAKNLKWMDKFNDLRKLPSHSSENREYNPGDFEYIDYVYDAFNSNLENFEIGGS